MNKKVVITGIGAIGPFGAGNDKFWQGLIEGKNFLRPMTRYSFSGMGGEVPGFFLMDFVKDPKLTRIPMVSQYAIASAVLAVSDSGIDLKNIDHEKAAVVFGTSNGPCFVTEKIQTSILLGGKKTVNPLLFQESVFNAPAGIISILFGIKGPCIALPLGMVAAGYGIPTAINYLVHYGVDCVIIVASDELTQASHEAYSHLNILSQDNHETCMRPFDKARNGMVISEGGVALILETDIHAIERGAKKIYGEISGYGMTSDGYRVADNNPDGSGLCWAMENAINHGQLSTDSIDYIVASALSIKKIDLMETRAIKKAFGKRAYDIPVSSIKSSIGETQGPDALFNIAAGAFAIRDGIIPPTINYQFRDDECDLDIVPNCARKMQVNTVLANAFSWGGMYSSTIIRRFQ